MALPPGTRTIRLGIPRRGSGSRRERDLRMATVCVLSLKQSRTDVE